VLESRELKVKVAFMTFVEELHDIDIKFDDIKVHDVL